ncbi:MAG: GtrA family protein [Oscillospiraceae bacterium]|jgi:putative flippase GtrA|nr:GtrA family protein [Oscillospiraceae bacterium]
MIDEEQRPVRLTLKQNILQTVKYFAFASSAGAIQLGSFTLMTELGWFSSLDSAYWPRHLISLVLSVLWNFTFNRRFTFKSIANVPVAMLKVFGYYCVFTPISLYFGSVLTAGQPDGNWVHYAVEIGTMLLNGITEFLFYRFVVYRKTINTNTSGQREEAKKRELEQNGAK